MRIRLLMLVMALGLLLGGTGCGRVHELYYLQGTFNPEDARGWPFDQIAFDPNVASIKGKTLLVKLADPTKTINRDVSKISRQLDDKFWREKWQPNFEQTLANQLWQSAIFRDVCAASDSQPIKNPDLIFRVALTQFHEGNKWLRAYIAFGAGATRVQWEGAIVEAKTNRVLFAFADARVHPGGPSFLGFPLRVWRGPALIAEDLRYASRDLKTTLREATDTTAPLRPSNESRPLVRPAAPATPPAAPAPEPANPESPAEPEPEPEPRSLNPSQAPSNNPAEAPSVTLPLSGGGAE